MRKKRRALFRDYICEFHETFRGTTNILKNKESIFHRAVGSSALDQRDKNDRFEGSSFFHNLRDRFF